MMGKTHDVVGVTTAVGVGYTTGIGLPATGLLAVAALLGSRLPDDLEGGVLTHRGVTHRVWFVGVVAVAVWLAVMALWQWTWFEDNVLARGRDSGIPVDALGTALALLLSGGLALGYAMHLVADMCTIHGLDVGKKKNGKPRRVHLLPEPMRIRTGSMTERMLRRAIYTLWIVVPALIVSGCGGESSNDPTACAAAGAQARTIAQSYIAEAAHLTDDKVTSSGGAIAQVRVRIPSAPDEKPFTVDLQCTKNGWAVSEAQQAAW